MVSRTRLEQSMIGWPLPRQTCLALYYPPINNTRLTASNHGNTASRLQSAPRKQDISVRHRRSAQAILYGLVGTLTQCGCDVYNPHRPDFARTCTVFPTCAIPLWHH